MIKIALIDDHEIFLRGLKELLSKNESLEIVDTFLDAEKLLLQLPELDIDVLLLDLQLPNQNPEKLLQKIKNLRPDLKIIYLTLIRGNKYFNKLSKIGFDGYILKDSSIDILLEAIEIVNKGGSYYGDRYNGQVEVNTATLPSDSILGILSKREREVLRHVSQELSSADIAEKLFVSVSTIDSHRKNIMIKLGVDNIVGLVKIAVQNGLI